MTLNARQLTNNDTTDIGYDLVLDNITALSGDVGVTKLMIGVAGTNSGLVAATVPLPIGANTVKDGTGTVYAPLVDADGHLQVDIVGALPAGTNAIGKLAANSGIDIGDVDITSVPSPLNVTGAGVELGVLRVTLANDGTGLVSVDDNGGSLTVDGTFWQTTQPVSAAALPLPTGAATSALQLPDSHNVTVDNAAGAAAVNIQDGGNIITVDGTVAVSGSVDTELTTADLDTGVGTDTRAVVGLVGQASGGGQLIGSTSNALDVNIKSGGAGDGTILDGVTSSIKATVLDYVNSNPLAVRLTDTGGDYVGAGAGTQYVVDVALGATPTGTLAVAKRDDALSALTPIEGDAVELRVDANGALWVIPSGTVTVGGTVTANLGTIGGAATQTTLAAIDTKLGGTLTVGSHAVTNAGTFAVQVDGSALTALQLIDDIVHSGDAALAKYAVIGAVLDDTATGTVTENQAHALRMSTRRALLIEGVASGTAVIVSAASLPLPTGAATETTLAAVDTKLGGTLTVGSHAVTNAGTFAVQAAQTGTWTVQPGNTANTTAWLVTGIGGTFPVTGTVTANAGTGPWPVTDNAGSLTVDGSVSITGAVDTELTTADLDTGVGTDTRAVIGIVLAASGGGVLLGGANPMPVSDNGGSLTVDGTFWQATQPVSLVSVPSHAVTNAGTFAVQVDGAALTALQLIDNIVNVVDGAAGATPTGVAALAVRDDVLSALTPIEADFVSLRTDANGALWVIPSGTVTISGTVTANAGTNLNTSALALEAGGNLAAAVTALQILDNIVAGSEAQCDVITQPARAATTDTITAKLATDAIHSGTTALTPKFAFANIAASTTDGALVAAVPTKKLRVLSYEIMVGATATNVTVNSKPAGAGTAISMLHQCGANGGISVSFSPLGHYESAAGEGLTVTTGTGSTAGVQVQYVEV